MNLHIVLMGVLDPRTVGEIARIAASEHAALKFIEPRVEFNEECFSHAEGASQKIVEAKVFRNWKEYCEDAENIRVVFSTSTNKESLSIEKICERIRAVATHEPIPLSGIDFIFTDSSVTQESSAVLESAHFVCRPLPLPLTTQALLALQNAGGMDVGKEAPRAPTEDVITDLRFPEETIQDWLKALKIDNDANAIVTLKRLLNGRLASKDEWRILSAVIQQTVRKLTS